MYNCTITYLKRLICNFDILSLQMLMSSLLSLNFNSASFVLCSRDVIITCSFSGNTVPGGTFYFLQESMVIILCVVPSTNIKLRG
uniref:Uncharacterized protein n=1 Tax=Arundo donax TaxID=35708 RepID=A0A0A9DYJ5_ARUDO